MGIRSPELPALLGEREAVPQVQRHCRAPRPHEGRGCLERSELQEEMREVVAECPDPCGGGSGAFVRICPCHGVVPQVHSATHAALQAVVGMSCCPSPFPYSCRPASPRAEEPKPCQELHIALKSCWIFIFSPYISYSSRLVAAMRGEEQ